MTAKRAMVFQCPPSPKFSKALCLIFPNLLLGAAFFTLLIGKRIVEGE